MPMTVYNCGTQNSTEQFCYSSLLSSRQSSQPDNIHWIGGGDR